MVLTFQVKNMNKQKGYKQYSQIMPRKENEYA